MADGRLFMNPPLNFEVAHFDEDDAWVTGSVLSMF